MDEVPDHLAELHDRFKNMYEAKMEIEKILNGRDTSDIDTIMLMFLSDFYLQTADDLEDANEQIDFFAYRLKSGVEFSYKLGMTSWGENLQ